MSGSKWVTTAPAYVEDHTVPTYKVAFVYYPRAVVDRLLDEGRKPAARSMAEHAIVGELTVVSYLEDIREATYESFKLDGKFDGFELGRIDSVQKAAAL